MLASYLQASFLTILLAAAKLSLNLYCVIKGMMRSIFAVSFRVKTDLSMPPMARHMSKAREFLNGAEHQTQIPEGW